MTVKSRSRLFLKAVCLQLVLISVVVSSGGQNAFAETTITLDGRNCAEIFKGLWLDFSLNCIVDDPFKISSNTTLVIREGFQLENKAILENHGKLEIQGSLSNRGTFLTYGSVNIDRTGVIFNRGVLENEGVINSSGQLDNHGEILNIGKINSDHFQNIGSLTNNGTIDNIRFLDNEGTLINGKSGIINNKGVRAVSGYTTNFYNTGTAINDGTITLSESALENRYDQYTTRSAGTFSNSGTIKIDTGGRLANVDGTIHNSGAILNNSNEPGLAGGGSISNTGKISNTHNSLVKPYW